VQPKSHRFSLLPLIMHTHTAANDHVCMGTLNFLREVNRPPVQWCAVCSSAVWSIQNHSVIFDEVREGIRSPHTNLDPNRSVARPPRRLRNGPESSHETSRPRGTDAHAKGPPVTAAALLDWSTCSSNDPLERRRIRLGAHVWPPLAPQRPDSRAPMRLPSTSAAPNRLSDARPDRGPHSGASAVD
jgi:hypothetical protein